MKKSIEIPADTVFDEDIDLKELGMLVFLLAYEGKVSINELHKALLDREGRYVISRTLKGLERAGYIYREPVRNGGGQLDGWYYEVRDTKDTKGAVL